MNEFNRESFNPAAPKPVLSEIQITRMKRIQGACYAMAIVLEDTVPDANLRQEAFRLLADIRDRAAIGISRGRTVITPEVIANWFMQVERLEHRVIRVWMNAVDYADVRKFGRDILDVESSTPKLKQGIMCRCWNAEFRVGNKIPQGFVCLISDVDGEEDLNPEWKPLESQLIGI